MLVAYHWKLNEDLIYGGAGPTDYLQVIERHEFSRMVVPLTDRSRIEKELPLEKLRAYASQEAELGDVAKRNQRWHEAIVHYQQCVQALERFRHPAVLELASECYLDSARCALANGKASLCLSFLRQYFLISEATKESIELKRVAREHDNPTVGQIKLLPQTTDLTFEQLKTAIEYVVEYPLPERVALGEKIVERFRSRNKDGPKLLWYLARCYMAQGRWDDAHSLLAPLAATDDLIREHLDRWQGLLFRGYGRWTPRFGTVPNDCDLDVTDAVNRGLIFLANALYHDAREWLLFALEKAPRDPFALFGHGLFLWRQGWFSLATKRLELAKDALESYPADFRFVTFVRVDETCEPRSYAFNPLYPIFNIPDCIERVASREPFVSYAIIP